MIKVLASEKDENEKRYHRILAAIADKPQQTGTKSSVVASSSPDGSITPTFTPLSTASTIVNPDPKTSTPDPTKDQSVKTIVLPSIVLPTGLQRHHERIHHHSYLIQNLLSEIASLQYNLDLSTRDRMHNTILNMHWEEWSTYRLRHGHEHFEKMLGVHPDVVSQTLSSMRRDSKGTGDLLDGSIARPLFETARGSRCNQKKAVTSAICLKRNIDYSTANTNDIHRGNGQG